MTKEELLTLDSPGLKKYLRDFGILTLQPVRNSFNGLEMQATLTLPNGYLTAFGLDGYAAMRNAALLLLEARNESD